MPFPVAFLSSLLSLPNHLEIKIYYNNNTMNKTDMYGIVYCDKYMVMYILFLVFSQAIAKTEKW